MARSSGSSSERLDRASAGRPPARVYLDYAGFSPVDPRVVAFMRPFLEGGVGNPAALHSLGLEARASLDGARAKVARLVGRPRRGRDLHGQRDRGQQPGDPRRRRRGPPGRHVVASAVEHISVLQPVPRPREAGLERDLVAGRRRRARSIPRRSAGPCGPTRRSSRSWPPTARSAPCSPCARSAGWPGVRACPFTSTASARSGRLPLAVDECRDRSADDLVERSLRAAGRRGALGPARGSPGADRPGRRAGRGAIARAPRTCRRSSAWAWPPTSPATSARARSRACRRCATAAGGPAGAGAAARGSRAPAAPDACRITPASWCPA